MDTKPEVRKLVQEVTDYQRKLRQVAYLCTALTALAGVQGAEKLVEDMQKPFAEWLQKLRDAVGDQRIQRVHLEALLSVPGGEDPVEKLLQELKRMPAVPPGLSVH
jgi:hypothetical protein